MHQYYLTTLYAYTLYVPRVSKKVDHFYLHDNFGNFFTVKVRKGCSEQAGITRHSAVAEKLRDKCVQYAVAWLIA